MIVTVDECIIVMAGDLKHNIWTCDPASHMLVVQGTLELNFSVPSPLIKITLGDTTSQVDVGITKVKYVDDETKRQLSFENNSKYSMDGLSVHTIGNPRNYTVTSGGTNDDLFRTGG